MRFILFFSRAQDFARALRAGWGIDVGYSRKYTPSDRNCGTTFRWMVSSGAHGAELMVSGMSKVTVRFQPGLQRGGLAHRLMLQYLNS